MTCVAMMTYLLRQIRAKYPYKRLCFLILAEIVHSVQYFQSCCVPRSSIQTDSGLRLCFGSTFQRKRTKTTPRPLDRDINAAEVPVARLNQILRHEAIMHRRIDLSLKSKLSLFSPSSGLRHMAVATGFDLCTRVILLVRTKQDLASDTLQSVLWPDRSYGTTYYIVLL